MVLYCAVAIIPTSRMGCDVEIIVLDDHRYTTTKSKERSTPFDRSVSRALMDAMTVIGCSVTLSTHPVLSM